jgi:hypothetical protein
MNLPLKSAINVCLSGGERLQERQYGQAISQKLCLDLIFRAHPCTDRSIQTGSVRILVVNKNSTVVLSQNMSYGGDLC